MPILEVEIVLRPGETPARDLAARLAGRAGEIFGTPPGATWVKLKTLDAERYAENSIGPAEAVYPVFVSVLKANVPAREAMQAEVAALTAAIAQVCARPEENVHIIYSPKAAGRVAFGGKLIPDA